MNVLISSFYSCHYNMLRTIYKVVILCSLTFVIPVTGAGWALALTVRFNEQGTFSTPSFTQDDLTVSSPDGALYFLNLNGVGVNNSGVSLGETLVFEFEQLASELSLLSIVSGRITFELEAFNAQGTSLGLALAGPFAHVIPVSQLFDNQFISSFRITNFDDGPFNQSQLITTITYTPESFSQPIPEPATAMLVGFGVLGLLALGRRRRKMRK
jgi:hypothetical protein